MISTSSIYYGACQTRWKYQHPRTHKHHGSILMVYCCFSSYFWRERGVGKVASLWDSCSSCFLISQSMSVGSTMIGIFFPSIALTVTGTWNTETLSGAPSQMFISLTVSSFGSSLPSCVNTWRGAAIPKTFSISTLMSLAVSCGETSISWVFPSGISSLTLIWWGSRPSSDPSWIP